MTKKAFKLLLPIQAKTTLWFVSIHFLVVTIILVILYFAGITDISWIIPTVINSPKIFLLVLGIVYPLVGAKLFISYGLTRKQFFWANIGAISIVSLVLFIPILISLTYSESITPLSVIIHYLHMPLFYLVGWTSIIGFQLGKWHTSLLGILAAIIIFHTTTTITEYLKLKELATLGLVSLFLVILLLSLPRIIFHISFKR